MRSEPVVLVTGVGRREGLGYEICRQMMDRGYRVVLSARRLETACSLASALDSTGQRVFPLELNLEQASSVQQAQETMQREFGSLTALINNAAAMGDFGEKPSNADLVKAEGVLDDTVLGTWRVTQAMLPLLRAAQDARIVFVTSGAGSHGDPQFGLTTQNPTGPVYAVAKAGLNALTSLFATELAAERILVNAVCPGLTATFPGAENMGARPVAEGAKGIVWAATLPSDGPSGGFFRDAKPLPW